MLQSKGLQRVGHDLVTEQYQQLQKLLTLWAAGLNGPPSPLRVGVGVPVIKRHRPGGLWITGVSFPWSCRLEVSGERGSMTRFSEGPLPGCRRRASGALHGRKRVAASRPPLLC